MKYILATAAILIMNFNTYSQGDFSFNSLTVVRLKNGSALLEFEGTPQDELDFFQLAKYWITSNSKIALQNALIKAKKWANLNEGQMQEFEKEILRIRVTDKNTYIAYKRYIEQFTNEAKLIFIGYTDGTFSCKFSFERQVGQTINYFMSTTDELDDMLKMLQGKSVSKIDQIFN